MKRICILVCIMLLPRLALADYGGTAQSLARFCDKTILEKAIADPQSLSQTEAPRAALCTAFVTGVVDAYTDALKNGVSAYQDYLAKRDPGITAKLADDYQSYVSREQDTGLASCIARSGLSKLQLSQLVANRLAELSPTEQSESAERVVLDTLIINFALPCSQATKK